MSLFRMPVRFNHLFFAIFFSAPAIWGQADIACRTTADWGTGFSAEVTVTNRSATPISNWAVQFDVGRQVDTIWNAQVAKKSGSQYFVAGLDWDLVIPPNATLTFGFNGSPGN